jgi:hypothetical protein
MRLETVKAVHTLIYAVMVAAIVYILYCGVTDTTGTLLFVAIGLVTVEAIVFLGNGRRCPLTTLAQRLGDRTGHVGDTFLPERCTRYTFGVFGSLFVVGLALVVVNAL